MYVAKYATASQSDIPGCDIPQMSAAKSACHIPGYFFATVLQMLIEPNGACKQKYLHIFPVSGCTHIVSSPVTSATYIQFFSQLQMKPKDSPFLTWHCSDYHSHRTHKIKTNSNKSDLNHKRKKRKTDQFFKFIFCTN